MGLYDKYTEVYSSYKSLFAKVSDSANLCYKICDDRECCHIIMNEYCKLGTDIKGLNAELLFTGELLDKLKQVNDCYEKFLKSFLKFMNIIIAMDKEDWTDFNLFLEDQYLWQELSKEYKLQEDLKVLVNTPTEMWSILYKEKTFQKIQDKINLYEIKPI